MCRIFRIRNLLWVLLLGVVLLAALVLSYAWWLPSVLPVALRSMGVELVSATWQKDSNSFRLEGVRYTVEGTEIALDWVELPEAWTYWKTRGEVHGGSLVVTVDLEASAEDVDASAAAYGPLGLRTDLDQVFSLLAEWLPPVTLEAFSVGSKAGAVWLSGSDVTFAAGLLEGALQVPFPNVPLVVSADLLAGEVWTVRAASAPEGLLLVGSIGTVKDAQVPLEVKLTRGEESVSARAVWMAEQWIPLTGRAESAGFAVEPKWLPVILQENFESLRVGALEMDWSGQDYSGRFALGGVYANEVAAKEPFSMNLELSGDPERLRVESLVAAARWVDLNLSEPIAFNLERGSFENDATLGLAIDLGAQTYVDAAGAIQAQIVVEAGDLLSGLGRVDFELSGGDLRYADVALESVSVKGDWSEGRVHLKTAQVVPVEGGGGLELSGSLDLDTYALDYEYSANFENAWLNGLLAIPYFVAPVNADGAIAGTLVQPELRARLSTSVQHPVTKVIELEGDFLAEGTDRFSWQGAASSEGAAMELDLSVEPTKDQLRVLAKRFEWTDQERPKLVLEAPVAVTWDLRDPSARWETRLWVETFKLVGEDMSLSGSYLLSSGAGEAESRGLKLAVANVSMARVNRWLVEDLPEYVVEELSLGIDTFDPYLSGTLNLHLEEALPDVLNAEVVRLDVEANFSEEGVVVDSVKLDFSESTLLSGHCALPLRLGRGVGASGQFWQLLADGPVRGELSGELTSAFSEWLKSQYDVTLTQGCLELLADGTLEAPEGRLNLELAELTFGEALTGYALPALRDLNIKMVASKDRIVADPMAFTLRSASVRGNLSLPVSDLAKWTTGESSDWESVFGQAQGSIVLSNWSMEQWTDLMPDLMRRTGTVEGRIDVEVGRKLSGQLRFKDFALRPTTTMPSINQISGDLQLEDRELSLKAASATVGGHPVRFEGFIDTTDWDEPGWRIDIKGANVPLVRSTQMILRSDLDLSAYSRDSGQAPIVEGELNFRQSTLLVDIDPFSPKYEGGTVKKPPYFSIDEAPFADWQFDLILRGDRFMRVRSPYFQALLTANFKLTGSFEYPELLGTVRTADTVVRFPGATMQLSEGEAYITPAQPNDLQLNFKGVAQKAGYVVSMEVSETLTDPHIQFQSTPELSNAEIVRLLATGSLNGGGLGSAGLYLGQGLLGSGGFGESWTDRIDVSYGDELSREGKNTLGLQYDLSEDWYLKGEYDRYDAYNLDIGWRVYEK